MFPVNDLSPGGPADAAHRADVSASLTYEPFYGLHEKPFSLSADPRFLFRSPAHGAAFDELHAGIRRREGLIVLTGEIGTGKTTLCRTVLQHLDRRTFASFVADPFVSREDLLKTLLVDFGVTTMGDLARGRFHGASRADLSYPLYEFLDSLVPLQAFAVVVIDEAQNLSLPLLEEIRILSELERREKLLQVVLVGQPELRLKLKLGALRQVEQRVSVRCELTSLDVAGVAGYVRHRLAIASRGESRAQFTTAALDAVYTASSGVPRLINRICDRALQQAFASRALTIDADCVRTAIDDRGFRSPIEPPRPAPAASPAVSLPTPINTLLDGELSALTRFSAESAAPDPKRASFGRPRPTYGWVGVGVGAAAAAALVVAAAIGAPAWLPHETAVEGTAVAAMIPPRPGHAFRPAMLRLPEPVDTMVPMVVEVGPEDREILGYSILVASFQSRERAEQVVEELVAAGFGAHAVERSGGPTGRLVQVQITGYTSAINVERDLQRVRELPGGFGDARVVEQS